MMEKTLYKRACTHCGHMTGQFHYNDEEVERLRDMNQALNRSYLLDRITLTENENTSLRAAIAAKEEAERKLCRIRKAGDAIVVSWDRFSVIPAGSFSELRAALDALKEG